MSEKISINWAQILIDAVNRADDQATAAIQLAIKSPDLGFEALARDFKILGLILLDAALASAMGTLEKADPAKYKQAIAAGIYTHLIKTEQFNDQWADVLKDQFIRK